MRESKLSLYFFIALLLAALVAVCFVFAPYLTVFILSIVLGVVFRPLHEKIQSYFKNISLSSFISTLIVLIIILGPVALILTQVFNEAQHLYARMQDSTYDLNGATAVLQQKLQAAFPQLNIDIKAYLQGGLNWFVQNAGQAFSSAANAVMSILLSAIGLYYWFKDSAKLKGLLLRLSPMPDHYDQKIFDKLSLSVHSIIRGTLLISLIQGLLAGIGFTIFGIPNAFLWGTLACISAVIPAVGTSLVLIPAILYLFLTGDTVSAIGLLIWGGLAVGLIDNFLGPKFMSRGSKLHPFFILVSVLGGLRLFGPIGFLAGPLIFSLFYSLVDIYLDISADEKIAQG